LTAEDLLEWVAYFELKGELQEAELERRRKEAQKETGKTRPTMGGGAARRR
jgi:hypothetical protein